MTSSILTKKVQRQAYQLILAQFLGVIILAFAALLFNNIKSGFSVLMGGIAYVLPNIIFVWRVFRYVGASQMVQFLTAFMIGEVLKLFISGILFLVIVKHLPVSLLSELVGFVGAIVSFWIACLWFFSGNKVTST